MSHLGDAIMIAMADQGWTLVVSREYLIVRSPVSGQVRRLPLVWLDDPQYGADMIVAAYLLVNVHGLIWPWPPEPDGLVRGAG
jgi:hypothetical protein